MTGTWGRILARYGQSVTLRRGEEERAWRGLWRRFYDTIAIEGRENPRCRMTQMPKRFWGTMTEFQNETEERKELAP